MKDGINPLHADNAARARQLYLDDLNPEQSLADWHLAIRQARKAVAAALRDSNYLRDIQSALCKNGGHNLVFRHLLAPPVSQDQFRLLCSAWSKTTENESRPVSPIVAAKIEASILPRLDSGLVRWLNGEASPSLGDVRKVLTVLPALIAAQKVAIAQRKRIAIEQEKAVIDLLTDAGWTKVRSGLVEEAATLPAKHFMHKTRFATGNRPQEVDIACGLGGTYVLAMECKVTNDETNSIKRVNDVVKKAAAWKDHWGNFVVPAALLRGVVAPKDLQRLTHAGVQVFWSHNLGEFKSWLETKLR